MGAKNELFYLKYVAATGNPWHVPYGTDPSSWTDEAVDFFCRTNGILEGGRDVIKEALTSLYKEAGVFETDDPDKISRRSEDITFAKLHDKVSDLFMEIMSEKKHAEDKELPESVNTAGYFRLMNKLRSLAASNPGEKSCCVIIDTSGACRAAAAEKPWIRVYDFGTKNRSYRQDYGIESINDDKDDEEDEFSVSFPNLNPCLIPEDANPELWISRLTKNLTEAYQIAPEDSRKLEEWFVGVYVNFGVLPRNDHFSLDEMKNCPTLKAERAEISWRSQKVSLRKLYMSIQNRKGSDYKNSCTAVLLENFKSRVEHCLYPFSRTYSAEYQMLSREDADRYDSTVLGKGLDSIFDNQEWILMEMDGLHPEVADFLIRMLKDYADGKFGNKKRDVIWLNPES